MNREWGNFLILCWFPHSPSISSFSLHFLILSPYFLTDSSSFPHSLFISMQPGCKAATIRAALSLSLIVLILIMTMKITMLMKVSTCKPSLSAIPLANFWCELPLNDRVQTSSPLNCNHRYYHHWYQYHPLHLLEFMSEATSMVTSTIPPPLYLSI